ncbi:MAG: glycosyltransferase [Muribaculaceae bacterium]
MKVVIVCKSHTQGGAAVVSHRLMNALRRAGHDARMLVLSHSSEEYVESYAKKWRDGFNFLAERLQIFLQNGFSRRRLFVVDTARWGADISNHPWVVEADVINLNWINQGALSLAAVEKLLKMGKKVVWTMHDMWNCTGICHHAYDCRGYEGECNNCRLLGMMAADRDLSTRVQRQKAQLYAGNRLRFVAVSNWLAGRCRSSSLMCNCNVTVIPNAFPIEQFSYIRRPDPSLGIDPSKHVLIMGAARLDDEVKGFDILIKVMQHIALRMPDLAAKCHLLLYGDIRNRRLLQQLAIPYTYVGWAHSSRVSRLYAGSDVVLSTSRYETLPGTLIEGLASGCVAVTFDSGGQSDIVSHLETGYMAEPENVIDFAQGIKWAVEKAAVSREYLNHDMSQRFSSQQVAMKYIKLFSE